MLHLVMMHCTIVITYAKKRPMKPQAPSLGSRRDELNPESLAASHETPKPCKSNE